MKHKIYLYLFIFVTLIALYQFVSTNNMVKAKNTKIEAQEEQLSQLEDSIQKLHIKVLDNQYFSLENNDDALAYYDHLNLKDPSLYISDKLLETNESKG
ncbi:MAG: hydrolase, partial [Arenibacter sp.]